MNKKKTLIGECDVKIILEAFSKETFDADIVTEEKLKEVCNDKKRITETIEAQVKQDLEWLGKIKNFSIEIANVKITVDDKSVEES